MLYARNYFRRYRGMKSCLFFLWWPLDNYLFETEYKEVVLTSFLRFSIFLSQSSGQQCNIKTVFKGNIINIHSERYLIWIRGLLFWFSNFLSKLSCNLLEKLKTICSDISYFLNIDQIASVHPIFSMRGVIVSLEVAPPA